MQFIDLASQQARIRPEIERRILQVLDHGQYILGPEVRELEEKLQDRLNCKHAIGVASGTDALMMALMAWGIGSGDEVITVPYTWISTAEVVALLGATPVFVDIQEDTWNLDPTKLEAAITEKTKAIIPVGIYGQPADMTAIMEIAQNAGIPVLEDAAQSFGSTHHGRPSGILGDIGTTSFFPSKPLGGYGDGGAIFTNDDELAEKMRWIRVHGQEKKHYHPVLGINGRLDSMQAAIVQAKLDIFDEEVRMRQSIAENYSAQIAAAGCHTVTLPQVAEANTSVWAQYTLLSADRDGLHASLSEQGIPSVSYYAVPLHLQPVFSKLGYREGDFPATERVADQCISLPMSAYVTEGEQGLITEAVIDATR